jgi:hypothetical protein
MDNRDEARHVNVKKVLRKVALGLLGLLVAASLLSRPHRSEKADAQLLEGANVPPRVRVMIERSCRDCHSEATLYPWYSYIAPVSWLIKSDVEDGREHLNFSKWSEYSVIRRERCLSEIANQVQDGGMPPSIYTIMHRDAKLSKADIDTIFQWTQKERARLIMERSRYSE